MDLDKVFWITPATNPEPEPMTRNEIIEQYQRAFSVINQKLFDNELPPIEIDYAAAMVDDPKKL